MPSKIILVCALFAACLSPFECSTAVIRDCGSVDGTAVKVDLAGCENQRYCPLVSGKNATLTATFQSKVESSSLKALVYGKLGPLKIKFNLPNSDACSSGVACPLKPNENYVYNLSIYVKRSYPKINVEIQFELRDANGKDVVCSIIPAVIVGSK
ncbi:unnamed protein product [Phyllotreta striolata]|uniref:MD-2-related lipid-recognition domain-containing protein n=1 Tax=Phyllotreta striolata TaxID=444603 RepID=A0A9P0E0A2_PHYSR|nr:unnamed protein product [Phyllotreta striolata]